jgi:hypothetical protein
MADSAVIKKWEFLFVNGCEFESQSPIAMEELN